MFMGSQCSGLITIVQIYCTLFNFKMFSYFTSIKVFSQRSGINQKEIIKYAHLVLMTVFKTKNI